MANLIVKSEVKRVVEDLNVSKDFYERLEREVAKLISKAEVRAEANGRKTVCARDL